MKVEVAVPDKRDGFCGRKVTLKKKASITNYLSIFVSSSVLSDVRHLVSGFFRLHLLSGFFFIFYFSPLASYLGVHQGRLVFLCTTDLLRVFSPSPCPRSSPSSPSPPQQIFFWHSAPRLSSSLSSSFLPQPTFSRSSSLYNWSFLLSPPQPVLSGSSSLCLDLPGLLRFITGRSCYRLLSRSSLGLLRFVLTFLVFFAL